MRKSIPLGYAFRPRKGRPIPVEGTGLSIEYHGEKSWYPGHAYEEWGDMYEIAFTVYRNGEGHTVRYEWCDRDEPRSAFTWREGDYTVIASSVQCFVVRTCDVGNEPVRPQPLAELPAGRSLTQLLVDIEHPDFGVRLSAFTQLSAMGDPRVVPALIDCLGDVDAAVQHVAARALKNRAADRAVLEQIAAALAHDDRYVREEITKLLLALNDPPIRC